MEKINSQDLALHMIETWAIYASTPINKSRTLILLKVNLIGELKVFVNSAVVYFGPDIGTAVEAYNAEIEKAKGN